MRAVVVRFGVREAGRSGGHSGGVYLPPRSCVDCRGRQPVAAMGVRVIQRRFVLVGDPMLSVYGIRKSDVLCGSRWPVVRH